MKKLIIGLCIIIFIMVIPVVLIVTPLDKDFIIDAINLSPSEFIVNSMEQVDIVNGGEVYLSYKDIGKIATAKVREEMKSSEGVIVEAIKISGNDNGEIIIKVYIVPPFDKFDFPTSIQIKLQLDVNETEVYGKIKSVKVGRIPLPVKKIIEYIEINENEFLKDNEVVTQLDLQNLEFQLELAPLVNQFESIGEVSDIGVNDKGIYCTLTPKQQFKEIVYQVEDILKPAAKNISKGIEKINDSVLEEEKETLQKIQDIVTKLRDNKIEEVKFTELAEVIEEIKSLSPQTQQLIVEILNKELDDATKQKILNQILDSQLSQQ